MRKLRKARTMRRERGESVVRLRLAIGECERVRTKAISHDSKGREGWRVTVIYIYIYIYMGASDLSGAFFFFCVSCAVSLSLFYSKSQSSQLSTLVNSRVGVFWKIHFLFGCTFILVFTRNGIRFFSFFF